MAARLIALLFAGFLSSCFQSRVNTAVGKNTPISSPGFSVTLTRTAKHPWITGNSIKTLPNGRAFFPPMLEAIENAKQSITFETFAFVEAPVTREFTWALAAKAREGIPVLMILDDVGSRKAGALNLEFLRQSGVKVHLYHPINILRPRYSDNRTHRKILVVDGKVAFTGGAGFAYAWSGNAEAPDHWRDTQYEIRGPAVARFQHAFSENWFEMEGEKLRGSSYFPKLKPVGPHKVQVVYDGPWDEDQPLAHSVLAAINGARKSLILQQSYFVPNRDFRRALLDAANRGVDVQIMVPNHLVDSKPTRYASQNHWAKLLRGGIRIFQYEATMLHSKLLIADNRITIMGSGNLDNRSFFINDEINVHVNSPAFAREQLAMYRRDLSQSREITLQNLPSVLEPAYKRFLAWFLASQL